MDISISEAHNRLSSLLKQVEKGPILIRRRGKTVGVIISPDEFKNLRQARAYLQMANLSHALRDSGITAKELCKMKQNE